MRFANLSPRSALAYKPLDTDQVRDPSNPRDHLQTAGHMIPNQRKKAEKQPFAVRTSRVG